MLRDGGRGLRPVGQPRDPVQRPADRRRARRGRRDPEERQVRQRRSRRRQDHRHHDVPGRRPADPRRHLLHAPPGVVLRGELAGRAPTSPRTATSSRSTSRPDDDRRKPVLGGGEFIAAFADRPEVQAFQTYLVLPPTWANAEGARHASGRLGQRQQGPGPANADQRRSTSSRSRSCRTRTRCSGSTAPT